MCAHVTPPEAELNRKISKLETERLELESRIEQQSQSHAALTDRLHAVVQENERKTKEIELRTQAHAWLAVKMDVMARYHELSSSSMILSQCSLKPDASDARFRDATGSLVRCGRRGGDSL